MRHPPQLLADVVLHRLGGEGADGLLLRLGRPALAAKGAENPLQDEVDEATVGRRVKPRRAAVLGLQAVAEEVGEVAGLILVHPGGGHGHFPSVQGLHRLGEGEPVPVPEGGHSLLPGDVGADGEDQVIHRAEGGHGAGEDPPQAQVVQTVFIGHRAPLLFRWNDWTP